MVDKHQIDIPQDICTGFSNDQFEKMNGVALFLEPLWKNALGHSVVTGRIPSHGRSL